MSAAPQPLPAAAAPGAAPSSQDQRPLVLVIGADAQDRAMALDELTACGYRVAEAGDGVAGLREAKRLRPDLVVLTISSRAAETFETCAVLRAEAELAPLPILAAADSSDPAALKRAIDAGATDLLITPSDPALFGLRVKRLIDAGVIERDLQDAKRRADEVFESMTLLSQTLEQQVEQRTAQLAATQKKLLKKERELRQSRKMDALGQLAGGVAHEFNNHLTVMSGFSRAARDSIGNPDKVRDCLSEVIAAVDRAAVLTAQMLLFSRDQVLSPKVMNIGKAVEDMRAVLSSAAGRGIDVVLDTNDPKAVAKADSVQLTQAVLNLAVNARDAMPRGGRLTISCATVELGENSSISHFSGPVVPGRYVRLNVQDTGTGMDPATLERIFDPFFTTKEVGKGTGLGLSVVFGMVEQCGGMIDVVSTLGQGTTISLYLPAKAVAVPQTEARGPRKIREGQGMILVVDDEPAVLNVVAMTLRDAGYDVLPAHGGLEAIEVMREAGGEIDLFIVDVVIPGLGGVDLATIFAQQCPGKPILFMSGIVPELDETLAQLDAAPAYIAKPFTPWQLAEKVHETLDARPSGAAET